MKAVFKITLMFIILSVAGIGCTVILGFMTTEEGTNLLSKAVAVFVLLGICSALITKLSGSNSAKQDEK